MITTHTGAHLSCARHCCECLTQIYLIYFCKTLLTMISLDRWGNWGTTYFDLDFLPCKFNTSCLLEALWGIQSWVRHDLIFWDLSASPLPWLSEWARSGISEFEMGDLRIGTLVYPRQMSRPEGPQSRNPSRGARQHAVVRPRPKQQDR